MFCTSPFYRHRFFLDFSANEFETEVARDIPLLPRRNLWIQLDGCPIHYTVPVRQWMNDHYPQRWIGRGGPISWPPRSPDNHANGFLRAGSCESKS